MSLSEKKIVLAGSKMFLSKEEMILARASFLIGLVGHIRRFVYASIC